MQGRILSIRRFPVVAAALLALVAAVGCGDSGSSSTEVQLKTSSLSKAEFTKRANAVCAKTRVKFEKETVGFMGQMQTNPPKPSDTSPEINFVKTIFVPNFQAQIKGISAIGAPRGEETKVRAFLVALQEVVDNANNDPMSYIKADGYHKFGKAPQLARASGLTGCAEI